MILKKDIVLDNDPLLRKKSVDVALPLSKEDEDTLNLMMEYLENSQNDEKAKELDIQPGVGLAAPQIGILRK
jgi:N-formylmethionyl-tRNA deformylase